MVSAPIRGEYTISLADFSDAHKPLVPTIAPWYRQWDFLAMLAFLSLSGLLIWESWEKLRLGNIEFLFALALVVTASGLVIWKIQIISAGKYVRRLVEKRYESWKCKHQTSEISEERFANSCSCGAEYRNWEAFTRWYESENVLVLYLSNESFYTLPKRAFSPQQLEQFRDLLRRKLPPPSR